MKVVNLCDVLKKRKYYLKSAVYAPEIAKLIGWETKKVYVARAGFLLSRVIALILEKNHHWLAVMVLEQFFSHLVIFCAFFAKIGK